MSREDYDHMRERIAVMDPETSILKEKCVLFERLQSVVLTQQILKRRKSLRFESEIIEQHSGTITHQEEMANLIDVDANDSDEKTAGVSKFSDQGQRLGISSYNYLSHPVRIYSNTIATGSQFRIAISPWSLFSLVPSIRAKLRNYAYLHGNLKLKIVVSGTPFHYGRMLVSYQPVANINQTLVAYASMSTPANIHNCWLNYLSQAPGAATVNYTECKPLELTLPYIFHKGMFRLFNGTTAVSDVTPFDDLKQAGDLYLFSMVPLGAIGSASTTIAYEIYAWMEDAELGSLTGTQVQITTEARGKDERVTGPLEYVTSSASKILAMFKNVPEIGRYAKASSVLFQGVSSAAAVLGWSKPLIMPEPNFIKNMPYTNGAQCIGRDTALKISIDPLQETTVDALACGSNKDDMAIAEICGRESFFTQFTWAETDALMTPIFAAEVTPMTYTAVTQVSKTCFQPTASFFACQPFYYWRGDMAYRLDIACSGFHRGKLAIIYEPNIAQKTLIGATLSTHKQFMAIVDIQETQSFEFCIKWANDKPWLHTFINTNQYPNYGTSIASILETDVLQSNGFFMIVPFTRLVSPDGDPVTVSVFSKSMEMHVNTTHASLPNLRMWESQIGDQPTTCLDINKSTADTEHISEEHFGEEPLSYRLLLKRFLYDRSTLWTTGTPVGTLNSTFTLNIIRDPTPVYGSSTTTATMRNYFDYLRFAYIGLKGSVRHRIIPSGPLGTADPWQSTVISLALPSTVTADSQANVTSPVLCTFYGSVRFNQSTNSGIEVELPFYSPNLFAYSFATNMDGTAASWTTGTMDNNWIRLFNVNLSNYNDASKVCRLLQDVAAGEDFTFMRFQGAPFFSY